MRKAVATCTKCKLNRRIEMSTLVYDQAEKLYVMAKGEICGFPQEILKNSQKKDDNL